MSYATHLVELANLYFTACNANPASPDLTAFNASMDEVPLANRPHYIYFLGDMQEAIRTRTCQHPVEMRNHNEAGHSETCTNCGYRRSWHMQETDSEGWMGVKIGEKVYGSWTSPRAHS